MIIVVHNFQVRRISETRNLQVENIPGFILSSAPNTIETSEKVDREKKEVEQRGLRFRSWYMFSLCSCEQCYRQMQFNKKNNYLSCNNDNTFNGFAITNHNRFLRDSLFNSDRSYSVDSTISCQSRTASQDGIGLEEDEGGSECKW